MAMKERVEVMSGTRGFATDAAVTWDDLVQLKLIKPEQVPRELGSHRAQ
jgi:hypothetical protein